MILIMNYLDTSHSGRLYQEHTPSTIMKRSKTREDTTKQESRHQHPNTGINEKASENVNEFLLNVLRAGPEMARFVHPLNPSMHLLACFWKDATSWRRDYHDKIGDRMSNARALPDPAVEAELLELGKEIYRNYLQEGGKYAIFEVIKSDVDERRVMKNHLAGSVLIEELFDKPLRKAEDMLFKDFYELRVLC